MTVDVIPFHILEKNVAMPFHIPSKKDLILVHTWFQLVPNQERTTSATPLMVSITVENTP